jgi:hypothetical protein
VLATREDVRFDSQLKYPVLPRDKLLFTHTRARLCEVRVWVLSSDGSLSASPVVCVIASGVLPGSAAPPVRREPAVVLVSLDGFRHDYASIHNTQNLKQIGAAGAEADVLVPAFPSMTFSNDYSLATGLYANHHLIVDNAFYDPASEKDYHFARQGREAEWYRGQPLWALAEKQGVRSAVFSWPGSEALSALFAQRSALITRPPPAVRMINRWTRLSSGCASLLRSGPA